MSEHIPLALAEREERRARANGQTRGLTLDIASTADCAFDPARRYLIKGLIYPGELSVWYGPPGCGKTFLAQHVSHSIARGVPVFGRRVQAARTLYLALEGGGGFAKRIAALNAAHGLAPDFCYYARPLNLFADPAAVAGVIATVRDGGFELAFIDTLSRAMSGGNENAPEDMTQMIGVFDRIRSETGAHVANVHHSGKDIERGARGHSSLKGAVDVEIEVTKSEITGERAARIVKARDDSDGQAHAFRLKVVDLGHDSDGDRLTTCVVEEMEGEVAAPAPRSSRLAKGTQQALGWLREALDEYGEPAPAWLPHVRVTTKDHWIAIGKKRTSETSDQAIRKAIARAITNLTVVKMIAVSAPYIWVIE